MTAWPSVSEERVLRLKGRFAAIRNIAALESVWQTNTAIVSIVFFVLTCMALLAWFGLMALLQGPRGLLTAVPALAVAELLIRRRRMFGTGIESALWLGGLFAFIIGLPSEGKPEAVLVFAAAAGIAGLRVRNGAFGALAAMLVVAYVALKFEHRLSGAHAFWSGGAAPAALLIAVVAAVALCRMWARPSTEELLAALVMTMPLSAYVAGKIAGTMTADRLLAATMIAIALLYMGLAVHVRHHVLLVAGAIAACCAIVELRDIVAWPLEWRLMMLGGAMIAFGIGAARRLQGRTSGIVVTAVDAPLTDALQGAATFTLAHHVPVDSGATLRPGGGSFGGGGASGGYDG